MKNKQEIINALDDARKAISKEIMDCIKIGDYTNARKYITTTRHLAVAADFMGKKNG